MGALVAGQLVDYSSAAEIWSSPSVCHLLHGGGIEFDSHILVHDVRTLVFVDIHFETSRLLFSCVCM